MGGPLAPRVPAKEPPAHPKGLSVQIQHGGTRATIVARSAFQREEVAAYGASAKRHANCFVNDLSALQTVTMAGTV